ncbi:MAG: hypothetical protein WD151_03255 [Phycisphaeraceae bacterium]
MLTQRFGLYIILTGLVTILTAIGLAVEYDISLLLMLFIAFNGLLVTLAGVWMWVAGRSSV